MRLILTAIVASLMLAGTVTADTINVPADYPTIQDAASAANGGDVIEVSQYHNESGTLVICKDLIIQCSDVSNSKPTIDAGGNGPVIDLCSTPSGATLSLINIQLINGQTVTEDDEYGKGGCLFLGEGSTANFYQCDIENCMNAGNGGAFNVTNGRTVLLDDCNVTNCSNSSDSQGYGGVVYCGSTSSSHALGYFTAIDTSFTGCYSDVDGGVACLGGRGTFSFSGCNFVNCSANVDGGALYRTNPGSTMTIENSSFNGCTAQGDGGAIYWYGNQFGSASVTGCAFDNCTALDRGGAFRLVDGSSGGSVVSACTFTENEASYGGAADASGASISGCVFKENVATINCGGLRGSSSVTGSSFCGNTPNPYCEDVTDAGFNDFSSTCIPLGHCCIGGGCIEANQVVCLDSDGTFTMDGCESCPEPEPDLGGCCINGACIPSTAEGCFDGGGAYAGDGVECEDAGCPETCLGDLTGDNQVTIIDLLFVIEQWGVTCP